ncbi:MAG TPA: formylglycine-generating enzyme family protein [Myxococcota bacterium]|nr:formylglycine-generating enzyme family protein [Myxococcota bacterium]HRY93663.1 formylglycine-generating enzyme family protein [Myxococcota bacterium]
MRTAPLAASLLCLGLALPQSPALAQDRPIVAVFDLEVKGAKLDGGTVDRLTDYLSTLLGTRGFQIVPRSQLKERLVEAKKGSYKECFDQTCQIEVGKELAAQKSLASQVLKIGSQCKITLNLYDLRRAASEASGAASGGCDEDKVVASLEQALEGMLGRVAAASAGRQQAGMVRIPAGEFTMGCSPLDAACEKTEKPAHKVWLDEFSIDRNEVSVAQYRECVQAGSCKAEGLGVPFTLGKDQPDWAWSCNWDKPGREQHPINCLGFDQARSYCEWAGKRLPTEAEWEKAARGMDGRTYPWGNDGPSQDRPLASIADETIKARFPKAPILAGYKDGYESTAPVGSFPAGASPYGALDMAGNVFEWVSDWYGEKTYQEGPARNPTGPTSGKWRVVRGGSWFSRPLYLRASARLIGDPAQRGVGFGVRCAVSGAGGP